MASRLILHPICGAVDASLIEVQSSGSSDRWCKIDGEWRIAVRPYKNASLK